LQFGGKIKDYSNYSKKIVMKKYSLPIASKHLIYLDIHRSYNSTPTKKRRKPHTHLARRVCFCFAGAWQISGYSAEIALVYWPGLFVV